jgi:glycosyltransferase involved in cell wall biosynthesis
MFCGSCMHDNTWARVLHASGYEVSLVPAYTPIRVDEENLSDRRVFFGGINVYLNSRWAWWRRLPQRVKSCLDHPAVIRGLARFGLSTEARELGEMTVAMLQGSDGPHRAAVLELAAYFRSLQPDVVLFTNALLSGALRELRAACPARYFCILQGDDIFLDGLVEPYRTRVLEELRRKVADFDGFVVQSRYYRDCMAACLSLPVERFYQVPLTIDCAKHDGRPKTRLGDPPVIGYFARICEEKGLHALVEACLRLRRRYPRFRLVAGGYLSPERRSYLERVRRLAAPLGDDFEYVGSPATHAEKVALLKSLDVCSVPTVYREPKGLYALESLANGVPVVLPAHGAFPELLASTGGGLAVAPNDTEALAEGLRNVLEDGDLRRRLAEEGWRRVREAHDFGALASASALLFGAGEKGQESPVREAAK